MTRMRIASAHASVVSRAIAQVRDLFTERPLDANDAASNQDANGSRCELKAPGEYKRGHDIHARVVNSV